MPLKRNSSQKSQTLLQFYQEALDSDDKSTALMGEMMVNWIKRIDTEFKSTEIYGLTSLYRLVLQSKDDWKSPKFVTIGARSGEFRLEYFMPDSKQPWNGAYVCGVTRSFDEAMHMLRIAMRESEGWKDSDEL